MSGLLTDTGCYRLYLNQQGTGSPAVALESGIAATSLSWSYVQPLVAEFTRVCSYDRAGLGYSTPCRLARTPDQFARELRTLLTRAAVSPPYVLAGHSFGGLLARAYACLHPNEVAGIVMIDPVSLQHWAGASAQELQRLAYGVRLSRRGALLARVGVVRFALWLLASGGRRLPKIIARASAGKGTPAIDRLMGEVQKLPPETWPVLLAHWSQSKPFLSMAEHLAALPDSASSVSRMQISRHIPVTILSAATATSAELAEREGWARQSFRGRHIQLPDCGHWLHLERPDAVAETIREMVEYARGSAAEALYNSG